MRLVFGEGYCVCVNQLLLSQAELVKWLTASQPSDRPFVTDICSSQQFQELRTGTGIVPKL